jgi:hypothetical protein
VTQTALAEPEHRDKDKMAAFQMPMQDQWAVRAVVAEVALVVSAVMELVLELVQLLKHQENEAALVETVYVTLSLEDQHTTQVAVVEATDVVMLVAHGTA